MIEAEQATRSGGCVVAAATAAVMHALGCRCGSFTLHRALRRWCLCCLQGGGGIYMGVQAFDASAAESGGTGTCKATPVDIRYATVT